jgi:hypothetical protein
MTSKEIVKSQYPNAKAVKRIEQTKKWYIQDGKTSNYLAEGTSKRSAWVNAKKNLELINHE